MNNTLDVLVTTGLQLIDLPRRGSSLQTANPGGGGLAVFHREHLYIKRIQLAREDCSTTFEILVCSPHTIRGPFAIAVHLLASLRPIHRVIHHLCSKADETLFVVILNDTGHDLHDRLPPERVTGYSVSPRSHNLGIPCCGSLTGKGFITRMLCR